MIKKRLASLRSLFRPLLFMFAGIVLLSLGVTSLFIWVYRGIVLPDVFYYLMLQFMPGPTRGILLLLIGIGVLAMGIWYLSGVVIIQRGANSDNEPSSVLLGYRRPHKPTRIVVLSGGPGMLMLSGLGEHVERLTCITPIQDPVEYYYRASSLFDAENVYYVVPTPILTKVHVELDNGTHCNVMHITNATNLAEHHVTNIWLEPAKEHAATPIELTRLAREALQEAEAIVLGPGSLFQGVIPNLLIEELRELVKNSKARKIYVCNLMTEPGLTAGFSVSDHIQQIKRYGGFTPDYVLVNAQRIDDEVRQLYAAAHQAPVLLTPEEYEETSVVTNAGISQQYVMVDDSIVIESDLSSSVIQYSVTLNQPDEHMAVRVLRHDPQKLTTAIVALLRKE